MPITPLSEAQAMPATVNVSAIAENALQVAFKSIADALEAEGYPVSGDFAPYEQFFLTETFEIFVRSMAMNNSDISEVSEMVDEATGISPQVEFEKRRAS